MDRFEKNVWKDIINEKKQQLAQKEVSIDSFSSATEAPSSRHVS